MSTVSGNAAEAVKPSAVAQLSRDSTSVTWSAGSKCSRVITAWQTSNQQQSDPKARAAGLTQSASQQTSSSSSSSGGGPIDQGRHVQSTNEKVQQWLNSMELHATLRRPSSRLFGPAPSILMCSQQLRLQLQENPARAMQRDNTGALLAVVEGAETQQQLSVQLPPPAFVLLGIL